MSVYPTHCFFCLQQAHTPSAMAGRATAIRQITDKREQKNGETYVNSLTFDSLSFPQTFHSLLPVLCVFSSGWILNVYSVDAHRSPDISVNTQSNDGFPSTLQPLLQTVSAHAFPLTVGHYALVFFFLFFAQILNSEWCLTQWNLNPLQVHGSDG